jgi:peptidoglycan/LPS O-acetylase OafA/YrhL
MYQKRTFVTMEASRGIAAICVMLNHYTGANLFPNPIAPDFFWCLSGFVIASSYEQKLEGGMPVREFLRRRLIRVYPMYILGTFVGLLAIIMMLRAELTSAVWFNSSCYNFIDFDFALSVTPLRTFCWTRVFIVHFSA